MKIKNLPFILLAFLSSCTNIDTTQPLDHLLLEIKEKYEIPALSIAVVSADSLLYQKAIGLKSIKKTDTVSINDAFHIGSNTKAFTATLCAKLEQNGLIDLESKILDIFPEFSDSINAIYKDVTLNDLLAHRAGIKAYTQKNDVLNLPQYTDSEIAQRQQFTKWLLQQPSDYIGSFEYSNAGYSIATAMIEKVTGQSWKSLMRQHVFDSLHITGNFGWPINNTQHGVWGHYFSEETKELIPHNGTDYQVNSLIESAGDLNMSAIDFGKYLQYLLQEIQVKNADMTKRLFDSKYGYSMGWHKKQRNNLFVLEHFGSAGTFHSYAMIIKEKNMAVVILSNAYTNQSKQALELIREIVLEKTVKDQLVKEQV